MRLTRWAVPATALLVAGLTAGSATGLTAGSATAQPAGNAVGSHRVNADRAAASYASLLEHFAVDDGTSLVREQFPVEPEDNPYSYEWPYSQVHIAALDLTDMAGERGRAYEDELRTREIGQERYWDEEGGTTGLPGYASGVMPPHGNGGDYFYDDNEWVGLADMQKYLGNGDRAALERAKQIFELVVSGWDTDPSHAAPGGVFWTQAPWSQDRNTVSNMPGAELGLRLYQVTRDPYYLTWSKRMVDWTNEHLQREDGLYWDHLDLAGNIEKTIWSYNQGVPVGVNVLLFQTTGEHRYLDEAKRIAAAAHRFYVTEGRLDAQPVFFNSIYFKNLLLLESVTGGTTYRHAMQDYADRMWRTHRDAATGLFRFSSESADHTQVIEQAAMVQIYAVLAWPASRHRILY
jgi:hypothetical protein